MWFRPPEPYPAPVTWYPAGIALARRADALRGGAGRGTDRQDPAVPGSITSLRPSPIWTPAWHGARSYSAWTGSRLTSGTTSWQKPATASLLIDPRLGIAIGLRLDTANRGEAFDECRTGLDHIFLRRR